MDQWENGGRISYLVSHAGWQEDYGIELVAGDAVSVVT